MSRLFFSIFLSLNIVVIAQTDYSIYFDNFDGVEYKIKDSLEVLTITLCGEPNADIGLAKFVFFKRGKDDYLFSTISGDEYSEPSELTNIKSLIPPILKPLYTRHPESIDEIDRIVKMIY